MCFAEQYCDHAVATLIFASEMTEREKKISLARINQPLSPVCMRVHARAGGVHFEEIQVDFLIQIQTSYLCIFGVQSCRAAGFSTCISGDTVSLLFFLIRSLIQCASGQDTRGALKSYYHMFAVIFTTCGVTLTIRPQPPPHPQETQFLILALSHFILSLHFYSACEKLSYPQINMLFERY